MKTSLTYRFYSFMKKYGVSPDALKDPAVIEMQREINSLENKNINFEIRSYPDGSWTARAMNVEGLLTGSRKQSDINELIKDAIFTYYGVHPKFANDTLLR